MLNFGFFKNLPLSVAFDLSRRSAQNFKIPAPLVCFEISDRADKR